MVGRTSSGFVEAPSLMRNSGSSSVGRWGARRAGGSRDAAAAMNRSAAARCVCQWNDLRVAAGTPQNKLTLQRLLYRHTEI